MRIIKYAGVEIVVKKSDWKSSFWSRLLFRIWTKISDSNCWNVGPKSPFDTRSSISKQIFSSKWHFWSRSRVKFDFRPFNNNSNLRFWFRFKLRFWAKIAFSKQVHHVKMNSFKQFSGSKSQSSYQSAYQVFPESVSSNCYPFSVWFWEKKITWTVLVLLFLWMNFWILRLKVTDDIFPPSKIFDLNSEFADR